MRILFVTPYYLPWVGGLEILVNQLVGELRARRHEIAILTSHRHEAPAGADEVDGVRVFRVDADDAIATRDPSLIFSVQAEIARIDTWFQPDVVHAHDVGPALWLYKRAVRARDRPLVVTLHNVMSEHFAKPVPALAKMVSSATWVTGVSRAVVDDALTYAPDIAGRVSVIENGITAPIDDVSTQSFDPPRLLCLGRLVEQKGFDIAIRALPGVLSAHPEARLRVAGSGPEATRLRALTAELGVDHAVDFLGSVERAGVLALFHDSTVVVMPSRFEGLPLVAMEAAWMGRPVVATRAPGLRDAVLDGETGVVVDVDDPHALATAISSLLSDPSRARELGRKARLVAERDFSLTRCADRYEDVYRALVAGAAVAPLPTL